MSTTTSKPFPFWKPILFFTIVVIGLYFVKWDPYYHKAFVAADSHSIGNSIINDQYQTVWQAMWQYSKVYFLAIWKAAVLGVLLGSLVQVLIPRDWLLRYLGSGRFGSILAGAVVSLLGMMCTCCAAPVAVGMRKASASVGSSVAFWMANPVLNPATLIFMGFVLGFEFSLIRLVAGVVMVLLTAYWVQRFSDNKSLDELGEQAKRLLQQRQDDSRHPFMLWLTALWNLFLNTVPVYVITVLLLSAARVWLFPHADGIIGDSVVWLVFFALVGTLFVIPTAAEIPIVQTLMLFGMGVGPAFALLMTLPSVSLPSLLMMKPILSLRSLITIGLCVTVTGIVTGLLAMAIL